MGFGGLQRFFEFRSRGMATQDSLNEITGYGCHWPYYVYNSFICGLNLNMEQMLFSIAWPIYLGQFSLICFLQILQLDSVVLCRGRSASNFHSGPLTILNFPVALPNAISWFSETTAITFPELVSQKLTIFAFKLALHYVHVLQFSHKKCQPSFETQVFRCLWFLFFHPPTSPQKSKQNERYGSCNRSINNWQRSIYPIMTSQRLGKIDNLGVGFDPHAQFMSILGYPSPNATWNPRKIRPQKKGLLTIIFP